MFYFLDEPIEPFYNNPTVSNTSTIITVSIAVGLVLLVAIITTILIKKGNKND